MSKTQQACPTKHVVKKNELRKHQVRDNDKYSNNLKLILINVSNCGFWMFVFFTLKRNYVEVLMKQSKT